MFRLRAAVRYRDGSIVVLNDNGTNLMQLLTDAAFEAGAPTAQIECFTVLVEREINGIDSQGDIPIHS